MKQPEPRNCQPSHGRYEALFDRLGAARPSIASRGGGPRYERPAPNELWHIDIKGPFFIQLARRQYLKTWIVGLLDDHSRFLLGLRIQTDAQATQILVWLRDCIELCGKPLDLMSDNGTPFVVWMPGVLTPQVTFTSLALFNILRMPMNMMANLIGQTVQVEGE